MEIWSSVKRLCHKVARLSLGKTSTWTPVRTPPNPKYFFEMFAQGIIFVLSCDVLSKRQQEDFKQKKKKKKSQGGSNLVPPDGNLVKRETSVPKGCTFESWQNLYLDNGSTPAQSKKIFLTKIFQDLVFLGNMNCDY